MTVINMKQPNLTPRDMTEQLLQAILDGLTVLDGHLNSYPDSLNHIRWVANEGAPGCTGAAVVVALMEKNISRVKARILNHNQQ